MNLCDFLDSIHYNVTTLFTVYRFVIQGIENQAKSMHWKLPHSTKRTRNGTQERLSGVSDVEIEWGHDFHTMYDCEINIRVSCVGRGSWSDIPKAICMCSMWWAQLKMHSVILFIVRFGCIKGRITGWNTVSKFHGMKMLYVTEEPETATWIHSVKLAFTHWLDMMRSVPNWSLAMAPARYRLIETNGPCFCIEFDCVKTFLALQHCFSLM